METNVTAYNLKTKEHNKPMKVTRIICYKPSDPQRPCRYRLAGVDIETNDGMSKFVNREYAEFISEHLGIKMETEHANP